LRGGVFFSEITDNIRTLYSPETPCKKKNYRNERSIIIKKNKRNRTGRAKTKGTDNDTIAKEEEKKTRELCTSESEDIKKHATAVHIHSPTKQKKMLYSESCCFPNGNTFSKDGLDNGR